MADRGCLEPEEVVALRSAAIQQEMVVAVFVCDDVAAYNRFVIAHQRELQAADAVLMGFFLNRNAQTGPSDYDTYKTALANWSALRSARDPGFCHRVNANFEAALGSNESLPELLSELPFPITTTLATCVAVGPAVITRDGTVIRQRSWLNRLLHSVFN